MQNFANKLFYVTKENEEVNNTELFNTTLDKTNKTATINSYTGTKSQVYIPSWIVDANGEWYKVTNILALNNNNNNNIQEIIMDKNLVHIPTNGLFSNLANLSSITLSDNQFFTESMFENTPNLKTLNFNRKLPFGQIPSFAFKHSGIQTLDLSDLYINLIGSYSFEGSGLINIKLPAVLTSIGSNAFSGSNQLIIVDISNISSETLTINDEAFLGCINLIEIVFPKSSVNTNLVIKNRVFKNTFLASINFKYFASLRLDGRFIFDKSYNIRKIYLPITNNFSVIGQGWLWGGIYNDGLDYKIEIWFNSNISWSDAALKLWYDSFILSKWCEPKQY